MGREGYLSGRSRRVAFVNSGILPRTAEWDEAWRRLMSS
jgi:hypothetical protein